MAAIYAISDIHGFYNEMLDSLRLIDLKSDKDNKLIFLGDYISYGNNSCGVLYQIKKLEETHPDQVVVLIGNHEQMFLNWYVNEYELQWLTQDDQLLTIKSFFKTEQWNYVIRELLYQKRFTRRMSNFIKDEMKKEHSELLQWLHSKSKSFFYETKNQIYVHAGISEIDPELWKYATEDLEFTWKYPAETGSFYKDIIAGHVSSVEVAKDERYLGKVYWDKESHYFIDGDAPRSNNIPILKYNTQTKIYSSFKKQDDNSWIEYKIS